MREWRSVLSVQVREMNQMDDGHFSRIASATEVWIWHAAAVEKLGGAKYISLIRKSVSKDDFFVSQLATTRVGIFESLAHRKHHSNDVVLR